MNTSSAKLPKHVAIICDGNRRWARSHGWEVFRGHHHAVHETIEPLVSHAATIGIQFLTFWIFSTENWDRSEVEIQGLMRLFREMFDDQIERYHEKNMKVTHIGDLSKLDKDIQEKIAQGIEKTKNNTGMTIIIAMNYGGRNEIVRGVRQLVTEIQSGKVVVDPSQITESFFESYLETTPFPNPDLIIRTSGEQRMSGFLSWSGQYAEYYFAQVPFPDFTPDEFDKALLDFQQRNRRFGGD